MFRFIHAADIHLDSPLVGLDQDETAPKERIRNATRVALRNLVDLALEERVDFLVIAGDIYDGDWNDYATGHFFRDQIRRLAPMPVYLIHGNHDATNKMTRSLPPLPHVHVFSSKAAELVRLDALQVAISGRSFGSSETRENLVREYPTPFPGYFNIGVLHTSLVDAEGHDRYAPCSPAQLANHGYDYWALGHIHKRRTHLESGPAIIYPGNLQGRNVRETGPKGVCLVTVSDDHRVIVEDRWLDDVRWHVVTHTANSTAAAPAVLAAGASEARAISVDGRLLVVRVRLCGECAAHDELIANRLAHVHHLRALLKDELGDDVWLENLLVETRPPRESAEDEGVDDARAEVARVMAEVRSSPTWWSDVERELGDIKSKLPDKVFSGPEGVPLNDAAWLASLLDHVLPMLFHTPGEPS